MPGRVHFSSAVSCGSCGNIGEARWEENAEPGAKGLQRKFLGISPGFRHEPQQQNTSADPRLVCERCGTALAD